ncbi:MAG TPA: metallophosphoesterase [Ktedonobacteraceae bacterium]
MSITSLLVISDLHLADGRNALEGFCFPQQSAFEEFLRAALPGGSLQIPSPPTLIINGDCFDFLAVPPYPADGLTTPALGLEKLAQIAAVHERFFAALRAFLDQGGKLTFLIGNHDIELCFAEVRAEVTRLLDPTGIFAAHLHFCLDQAYQPVPDVSIEHGNQYDFWNSTRAIWNRNGKALTPEPERIELPLGTQYVQRASLPIGLRYPYFERFNPPLGIPRQMALLSLLDPPLVREMARGIAGLLSNGHQALQGLAPGDEGVPVHIFSHMMSDFAHFQQEMQARVPTWATMEKHLYPVNERLQKQAYTLDTFFALGTALEQSRETALQAIFKPFDETGDEDTTRGIHRMLRKHPEVRVAVAGHTHITRSDLSAAHGQLYLNTATWTHRLAPPRPEELTPEVVAWLGQPDLEHAPLTSKTGYVFAWINTETGQPSSARLCEWQGGSSGSYRVL